MKKTLKKIIKNSIYHLQYWFARTVTYDGIVLKIDRRLVSKQVAFRMYKGKYERNEKEIISTVLQPDDIVFELGTGVGFVSLFCASICTARNVHTYEANPLLIPLIKRNFELNRRSISVNNAVLVNDPSEPYSSFYVCKDFYSSSLSKPSAYERVIQVANRDFLSEIKRIEPTFLIVDIEGYEYKLFQGFVVPDSVDKVLIELHPKKAYTHFDLVEYFRKSGFVVSDKYLKMNQLLAIRCHE